MKKFCEICGSEVAGGSPVGVCPACALRSAYSMDDDLEGTVVEGRYEILGILGKGGFGTVHRARQIEPVEREVALKILNTDRLEPGVVERFNVEMQAMAMMNHRNIAKLFDAGETEWGAPYFVMELVVGEPVTEFCDQNRLTPNERIELFSEICRAVQHAHHRGIIHCDLKPANIFVAEKEGRIEMKIIDFGISRAMRGTRLSSDVQPTEGTVIGTLEYMAPEQAQGDEDIDTRADVYSLGALLYELLTGTPPFSRSELKEAGKDGILKRIQVETPRKPVQTSAAG